MDRFHGFNFVKKVLKEYIVCRRLNERPTKLNQSSYRDFRINLVKFLMPTYLLTMLGPLLLTCMARAPKYGYYINYSPLQTRSMYLYLS